MTDTEKASWLKNLEIIATKAKMPWHSQEVHKTAVAVWFLDKLGIKEQSKRDEIMKAWKETPPSFGANASALGQQLGRETGKAKTERTFSGF